jgi:5-methylcytosine-specific restriction endonuclease McrA
MNEPDLTVARAFHVRLVDLLQAELASLGAFLEALAEFDRRKLFRDLGHASLFEYLHKGLKLSRGAAHYRRAAAWLVQRFPEVLEPIRDGRLCFTTVAVLASVVTEENLAAVLPRFHGLSKQEALELAAELKPRTVVPTRTVVTRMEQARPVDQVEEGKPAVTEVHPGELWAPRREVERTLVEPMTATSSRIHITVSREFLTLLKKARAGESHRSPGASDEEVLRAALEALIEKQGKRKACVPARVKREVVKRDQGKCQWSTHDGGICGATVRLEVDHVVPRGRGGPSTVENCRLLCKAHNLEAARQAYGDARVDRFTCSGQVAGEDVAPYGIPIARSPRTGVSSRPCSGRKPPRSGSSACASRSSSSSAPASSSSTTRARPWASRSAGGPGTTSGRCTSG